MEEAFYVKQWKTCYHHRGIPDDPKKAYKMMKWYSFEKQVEALRWVYKHFPEFYEECGGEQEAWRHPERAAAACLAYIWETL